MADSYIENTHYIEHRKIDAEKQADRQTDDQKSRKTDRQALRKAGRHTDLQTLGKADRLTDTGRHSEMQENK